VPLVECIVMLGLLAMLRRKRLEFSG